MLTPMGWDTEIEELRRRQELARRMGGAEKLARQAAAGRMDARARIAAVADPGTFREIGELSGFAS